MNDEFVVKRAKRKLKRDINKVFSGNFLKIITEIILNSDDSYKRLEREHPDDEVKPIIVDIKRGKTKTVSVIDYAEGLNAEDFRRIFTEYGAQHNLDENEVVRGLFGQGASDVLFYGAQSARLGKIESIKDKALHTCKFIVADEQRVKINTIDRTSQVKGFKKKHNIKHNGTVVSFGLGDNIAIPHKNFLKDKIEKFYMLRYVLADEKREIILKHDKQKVILSSKKFAVLKADTLIDEYPLNFRFESHHLKGSLKLYEDNQADPEEKVLIIDQYERVYDNTLFGLEEMSGAARIKGVLVLNDLYACLNAYLNQDDPVEILRDSRDGFDQRENFTKRLFALCKPYVQKQIESMNQKYEPKQYILDQDKEIKNALRKINEYYSQLKLEEIGNLDPGHEPPSNGIQFVRDKIFVTQNKTYSLNLLINANLVSNDDKIKISLNEADRLALTTKVVQYQPHEVDNHGKVTKSVILKGLKITEKPLLIKAEVLDYQTNTEVNIVKETIIYPENGLAFIPRESRIKPNKPHTLKLFVDISRFPLNTVIEVQRKSLHELLPEPHTYRLEEKHLITPVLAKLDIPFQGGKLHETHHFEANALDVKAKALIRIELPQEKDLGLEGLFSGLDAEYDSTATWQSTYIKETGKIKLNLAHIINKTLLNDLTIENLKKLDFTKDQYRYIFEIICFECAKQIVYIKLKKHEIEHDANDILKDIQTVKTGLFKSIFTTGNI